MGKARSRGARNSNDEEGIINRAGRIFCIWCGGEIEQSVSFVHWNVVKIDQRKFAFSLMKKTRKKEKEKRETNKQYGPRRIYKQRLSFSSSYIILLKCTYLCACTVVCDSGMWLAVGERKRAPLPALLWSCSFFFLSFSFSSFDTSTRSGPTVYLFNTQHLNVIPLGGNDNTVKY